MEVWKNTDRKIDEDLEIITDWFTASKVDMSKCEAISFDWDLPEQH